MADWSSLPVDLVGLVAKQLTVLEDFTAFRFVCRSYRSAVEKKEWRPEGCSGPPWLLLCCQGDDNNTGDPPSSHRSFLNLYKNKKKFVMDLPEIHGRRCWGTPYGWIITLGLDQKLHLFNPLSRRRIPLPLPQTRWVQNRIWESEDQKSHYMRRFHTDRAILIKRPPPSSHSSTTTSVFDAENFLLLTTNREETYVITPNSCQPVTGFYTDGREKLFIAVDYAVHNGQIYMIAKYGGFFVFTNLDPPEVRFICEITVVHSTDKLYLVESLGELLLIVRVIQVEEAEGEWDPDDAEWVDDDYHTLGFAVFKFNFESNEWIEVIKLGDCAVFVGDSQTMSLPEPEKVGCKKNVVYFTDDNFWGFPRTGGGHDMGMYHVVKDRFEPLYEGPDMISLYSTPNWFFPSFT